MIRSRSTLSVAALLVTTLGLTGCQNLNTMVTGEKFLLAPADSPRIEVELVVDPQDSLFQAFGDVQIENELRAAISELVLSLADVGMRFYPILSSQYGREDARPAYVMEVKIADLVLDTKSRLVEVEGQEPHIESSLSALHCAASASVEKRRQNAPPLVVALSQGDGSVSVRKSSPESTRTVYPVERGEEGQVLEVPREDVLAAVEKAVVEALRGTVKAIDRDLASNAR